MSFADTIAKDRGQPSTVRIGVVQQVSPLLINIQGTPFTEVGLISGYVPVVGDTVAVLGQSAVSADGSSWLVLGRITAAPDPAISVTAIDNGPPVVTSSLTSVFSGGGGAVLGVVFVAPRSGRVLIGWNVEISQVGAGFAVATPQVATGTVIAAGTVHTGWAASLDRTRRNDNTPSIRAGSNDLCVGLTPGASYNVALAYATNGTSSTFGRRSIWVVPAA